MSIDKIVSNQKYFNQLKNGASFSDNTSDYTPNLVGNVGDRIKYTFDIDLRVYEEATPSMTLRVSNGKTQITRAYGSWIDSGFSLGDSFGLSDSAGSDIDYCVITSISETIITYSGGSLITDATYTTLVMWLTTQQTALIFKPNLLDNNENFNTISKVSGSDCSWYAGSISTSWVNMTKQGIYFDFVTGLVHRVKYVSTVAGYYGSQKFSIEFDFIITPFHLEQYQTNLENNTIPDLYSGLNSLKFSFEADFLTALSNPNTKKTVRYDNNLGSIGWFNESYNGFNNLYSIASIVYKDADDNVISSLLTNFTTKFEVTVNGTFTAGDNVQALIFACQEQSKYTGTLTTLEQNFVYDNAIVGEGAAATNGANGIISNLTADIESGKMVIRGEVSYNSTQIALISGLDYVLAVTVANDSLSTANSDKVTLLADFNTYSLGNLYPLCLVDEIRIFQHPENPTTAEGSSSVTCWNEDGLFIKMPFKLDKTKDAILNYIEFSLIAFKDSSNYFTLDTFKFNIQPIFVSGIQVINYSDIRGYSLNDSDYFGKVLMSYVNSDANYDNYEIAIGQKISWKDWVKNLNADTIFYDNTKPNNNLNFKASNYSDLNGYDIHFVLTANCTGKDENDLEFTSDFNYLSPVNKVNDYNKTTNWNGTIQTFSEDGTVNYGGVIRTDANTLFKCTFNRISDFRVGAIFWGIHRIEESNNLNTKIYELSSIIDSLENNLLIPISGETKLKVTVDYDNNTVVAECLIDYTKLDSTKQYKLSSRIDDGLCSGLEVEGARLNEDGTYRLNEDGTVRIIE